MVRTFKITLVLISIFTASSIFAQGVTTSGISGLVTSQAGDALVGGNVVATHVPSGTDYGTMVGTDGFYTIPNMRVGGPYSVKVSYIGYAEYEETDIYLVLGSTFSLSIQLSEQAIEMGAVEVTGVKDMVFNADRTGAETQISGDLVAEMPSIRRSTRDLTRLDPRSDGNFSFGGRNWLYNNISLDGSYFNN